MKFLCVPCDSPMKLQSVGPPDRGSLSVVYSCPECGYEMAMLTNAYETQIVQSLGVRIGPSTALGAGPSTALGAGPSTGLVPRQAQDETSGKATGTGCPFSSMIPATEASRTSEPSPVRWTPAAEARLVNIPEFVRPMARTGIERFARERGALEIDETILDAAREFFGM
jgi:hypothetical protein